jgi:uncharacterized protein (TIGR03435 family)
LLSNADAAAGLLFSIANGLVYRPSHRLKRGVKMADLEVKLAWALRQVQNADAGAGSSLFTALSEQLGLRLEARKAPVEVLIVDSAEKVPVEN